MSILSGRVDTKVIFFDIPTARFSSGNLILQSTTSGIEANFLTKKRRQIWSSNLFLLKPAKAEKKIFDGSCYVDNVGRHLGM